MANINRKIKRNNQKQPKQKKQHTSSTNCKSAFLINRFKAFITDTFMVMMPIMYIVFYIVMGSREEFAAHKLNGWIFILIPHFIAMITFWYFKAQTPGMKAYELTIVDSNTLQRPTIPALINRYIITTISMLLFIPLFVPYMNKDRKTIQDIISQTCLIPKIDEN